MSSPCMVLPSSHICQSTECGTCIPRLIINAQLVCYTGKKKNLNNTLNSTNKLKCFILGKNKDLSKLISIKQHENVWKEPQEFADVLPKVPVVESSKRGGGGRVYPSDLLVGVCSSVLQTLTQPCFRPKYVVIFKVTQIFCKIHTCFQTKMVPKQNPLAGAAHTYVSYIGKYPLPHHPINNHKKTPLHLLF